MVDNERPPAQYHERPQ